MSDHNTQAEELSVEELEEVAGGAENAALIGDSDAINENCGNNCHC